MFFLTSTLNSLHYSVCVNPIFSEARRFLRVREVPRQEESDCTIHIKEPQLTAIINASQYAL